MQLIHPVKVRAKVAFTQTPPLSDLKEGDSSKVVITRSDKKPAQVTGASAADARLAITAVGPDYVLVTAVGPAPIPGDPDLDLTITIAVLD